MNDLIRPLLLRGAPAQVQARNAAAAYAVATLAPLAALGLRLLLRPLLGDDEVPFITFFLAVALSAWYGGLWCGVVTTIVSAALATAHLFEPENALVVTDTSKVVQILLFVAVGLSISLIAHGQARARREAAVQAALAREAEAEATRREQEFRALAEHSPDPIARFERSGRFVYVNPAALCLFESEPQSLLGKTLEEASVVRDPTVRERLRSALDRVFAMGRETTEEFGGTIPETGRQHWYEVRMVPEVTDDGGATAYVLAVARDITDRVRSQTSLAAALEYEHRIAAALQRALLIDEPAARRFPGLALATIYRSASDEARVGGDFYDFFALDGGFVALVVGDVAGKGLAAAMQTAEVRFTLRSVLREMSCHPPQTRGTVTAGLPEAGEALRRLNALLCAAYRLEPREREPGFVCLALLVTDPATGRAACACAGMEPPLMLRAAGDVETFEEAGPPLGILDAVEYPTTDFVLGRDGDTFLMTTDGLTEARREAATFFGPEGVARAAREALLLREPAEQGTAEQALARIGERIVATATEFNAGAQLQDDVCLMLVRRTAVAAPAAAEAAAAA